MLDENSILGVPYHKTKSERLAEATGVDLYLLCNDIDPLNEAYVLARTLIHDWRLVRKEDFQNYCNSVANEIAAASIKSINQLPNKPYKSFEVEVGLN